MSNKEPQETLEDVIAAIEKRYGEGSIHQGDKEVAVERIPTGSLALDYATTGGIPIGRFSRFYGGYSSAKSLTCWQVIKQAQKMGMTCAYYNIEKQYDKSFVSKIGIDTKNLVVVQGTTIEETGTKVEALLGPVDLHVIDSCSSAVSIDELNASIEDWQRGLSARVWGKVLRTINERFDHRRNVVIMVDQIRDSMQYGGGHVVPGGKSLDHVSSMSLLFKKGGWMFYDKNGYLSTDTTASKTVSGSAEADGMEILIRVDKSRVGRPLRTARMYLDLNKMCFDVDAERTQMAKHFNLIEQSGAWFTLPSGEKVHGLKGVRELVANDPSFKEQIDKSVARNF